MATLALRTFFFMLVATVVLVLPLKSVQSAPEILYPPYAAKDPTDLPPPIKRKKPKTVTVDLFAEEVITEIEPGKKAWVWTFNGTVPGPMIRVMEGDTVVINLTNDLGNEEPHNIDLHAAMGPGGGAVVTNVEPGETRTFSFKAVRQGSYIYHCAAEGMPWEHVAYGMFGMIVVEPKGGLKKVDREFYIGQSDWYHDALSDGAHGIPTDVYVLDEEKAGEEHSSLFTFNGHKYALADPALYGETIRAEQHDKVRFFFVTGGPNIGSNWHIIGTIFDKVYTGHVKDATRNEETVYVPPGSATVFELSTPVPGEFLIVDHALFRVPKGAGGLMHVDQVEDWPDDLYSPNPAELMP